MAINTNNVLVGTAQAWWAVWGSVTPGSPVAMPADPTTRTDGAAAFTLGSATVTDAAALSTDVGAAVSAATGIPVGTFVGTVSVGVSFTMVDINGSPVLATATGTSVKVTTGVSFGQPWGTGWTAIGATDQGVTYSVAPKENDIFVEEQMTPALTPVDTEEIDVSFTLAEDTLPNMLLAYGLGSIAIQAATSTLIGKQTLTLGKTLTPYSIGFESNNSFGIGLFRRAYIPKMVSGGAKVDTLYRRAKEKRMYAVTLRAICDPSTIVVVDQTAQHT
jgi:hypothetical protein